MDTATVLKNIEAHYDPKTWAWFVELRLGTGYGKDSEQRLDAFCINYLKGKRNETICFEIKVSRADFFHEIKKPKKRRAGLRLSNRFFFVTPKGLVKIEEIPVECGLIYINEDNSVETIIEAPYRESVPTWQFVASIARRLDRDRQDKFLKEQNKTAAEKIYNTAAQLVIDRYIDKWQKYNLGSREVPDKILGELKQAKEEINNLILEMLK